MEQSVKNARIERFDLKNKEAQEIFTQLTSEEGVLTSLVKKSKDVNIAQKSFLKGLIDRFAKALKS